MLFCSFYDLLDGSLCSFPNLLFQGRFSIVLLTFPHLWIMVLIMKTFKRTVMFSRLKSVTLFLWFFFLSANTVSSVASGVDWEHFTHKAEEQPPWPRRNSGALQTFHLQSSCVKFWQSAMTNFLNYGKVCTFVCPSAITWDRLRRRR